MKKNWKLSQTQYKYLKQGKILTDAEVDSGGDWQRFKLRAVAYHSRRCSKVLRKISLFEEYNEMISFIKKSEYFKTNKLWRIHADHTLLPFPMVVHILLDRPTKPGLYPYKFPTGMFTGLTGEFEIAEIGKRCILFTKSYWKGPKTKIPNFVVDLFSETLSRIGGEILMRKSGHKLTSF